MAISSRQLTFQLSGGPPYGIRLQGGNSNAPFVVSKIRPASKAEAIGLQEGDVIVAVNGITCRGLPHSTVTSLMDSADTSLQLLTLRGYTAYSDVAAVESLLGSQLAKLTTAEAAAIEQNRPEVAAPSGSVFGGVPESKPFVLQPITGKQRPFQQKTVESATYDSSLPGIGDHSNYSAAVTTNGFGSGQHQQLSSRVAADDVANPDNFYSREEQSYDDGGVSHHTVEETERKSFGGGSGSTTMTTVTRREYSTVSASSSGGFGRNNEFSNDPSLEFARQFLQQSDSNHQGGSVAKAAGGDRHKDWFGEQVENGTYRTQTVDNFRTNNGGGSRTNEIRQQQTYHVDSSSEKWNSPDRFSQTEQRPYGQDTGSLRRRQQPLQEQHQSQPPPRNEVPEVRVYQTVGADGQHSIVLPDFTISIGAGPTMTGGSGAGRIPPPVVTVTPADGHGSDGRPVTLIGPTSSPWRQNDQSDVPDNVTGHVAASGSTSTQDVYALSNARYGPTSTPGSETGRQMPQHRAGMLQQQQQQQHRVRYDDGNNVVVQQREEKSFSYNSNEANNANSSSVGSDWYGPVHAKHSTTTMTTEGSQSSRPAVGVFDVQIKAEPTPVNNSSRDFDAPYDGYLNSQQQQQQQQQQQRQQQQYHQQYEYEWSTTKPSEHELALNRKVDHVTVTVGDRPHFVHAAGGAPSASLHEMTAQSGPVTSSVYRAAGDHFEGNMESYQQVHQPTQYQQRPPISSQYGQSVRPLPVESDSNYGYENSFAAPSADDHYRPQYRPAPQLSEFGGGAPRSFDNNQYNGFPPISFDAHQPNGPSAYQHYPPPPHHHHQQQSFSQAGADTTTSIQPTDFRPKVGNKLPLNPHFQRDTGVDRQLGGQPADHVSHAPFAGPPPPSYAATAADYGVPFQQNSSYNHHQQQQFDSGPAAASYSGSSESTGWSTGNVWSPPTSHQWQPGADRDRPGYNSEPSGTAVDNSYGHAGPHSHYVPSAAGYDPYNHYNSSNIRHQTAVPSDGYHVMPEQAMAVAPPPPPAAAPPAPPPPPPNPYKVYGITSGTNDYERQSLESKVNLANSVAHSVMSPANSNSRGQKMFLRRQQNSHKWTKSGPDPVPEPPTKQQPHHQHQPSGPTTSWPGSSLQHSPNRPTPAAGIAHQAADRHGWGAAHGAVNESSRPSTNGSTVGFSLRNRSGSVDRLMSSSSSSLQGNSGGVTSSWSSTDVEQQHWSGRPQVPPSAAEVGAHHVMQRDGGQFSQHPSTAYRPVKLQFQNSMPPASGPRQPPVVDVHRAGHPPPPPPRNAVGVRGGQPVAFSDL